MMFRKTRRIVAATLAMLAASAGVAYATSSGAANADAQNFARAICAGYYAPNGSCNHVYGSSIYDVNPGAKSGQVQWNTYTKTTLSSGLCLEVYAGFGPFSSSGTAWPVQWSDSKC